MRLKSLPAFFELFNTVFESIFHNKNELFFYLQNSSCYSTAKFGYPMESLCCTVSLRQLSQKSGLWKKKLRKIILSIMFFVTEFFLTIASYQFFINYLISINHGLFSRKIFLASLLFSILKISKKSSNIVSWKKMFLTI